VTPTSTAAPTAKTSSSGGSCRTEKVGSHGPSMHRNSNRSPGMRSPPQVLSRFRSNHLDNVHQPTGSISGQQGGCFRGACDAAHFQLLPQPWHHVSCPDARTFATLREVNVLIAFSGASRQRLPPEYQIGARCYSGVKHPCGWGCMLHGMLRFPALLCMDAPG
jgi:hypothetical protein